MKSLGHRAPRNEKEPAEETEEATSEAVQEPRCSVAKKKKCFKKETVKDYQLLLVKGVWGTDDWT